jgi:hypothetical protein
MSTHPVPENNYRVGVHYYPDSDHFRASDLQRWLPELKALGVQWITLVAPSKIAIPEDFIRGLVNANIQPVLHFHLSIQSPPAAGDLKVLFEAYKNWGVNYVALFDRPNLQNQWDSQSWTQEDLVTRFLDIYLPLAETVVNAGLYPVFPPLEPGGDFWDTTFLRTALQEMKSRGLDNILSRLVIGAYAWAQNLPLNWGAGGPERWPGARPYFTANNEEDQRGFRIFDWYSAISKSELGYSLPIILLACGSRPGDNQNPDLPAVSEIEHGQRNLQLARLLAGEKDTARDGVELDEIPAEVLAGNFWLLAAEEGDEYQSQAWYGTGFSTLPVVQDFQAWEHDSTINGNSKHRPTTPPAIAVIPKKPAPVSVPINVPLPVPALKTEPIIEEKQMIEAQPEVRHQPLELPAVKNISSTSAKIEHYVLLPAYEWGVADWHLEVIRPYVKKYRPTVGFSIDEAQQARRVTIVGGHESFPDDVAQALSASGCEVTQIKGDGTSIAEQLKTL